MTPSSIAMIATIVLLAIVMLWSAEKIFAASTPVVNATTTEGQQQPHPGPQQPQTGVLAQIQQTMPNLKQALIIFTSLNGILIALGAALYVLRNMLDNQSASTLASIKNTQSRFPLEKNPK
ncbi:MAG: hypothetical protein P8Y28_08390 [Gammaproteobacteria bacterium]|jgi:hypothetical protein